MLIYHAGKDISNSGGTAADVLRKAPISSTLHLHRFRNKEMLYVDRTTYENGRETGSVRQHIVRDNAKPHSSGDLRPQTHHYAHHGESIRLVRAAAKCDQLASVPFSDAKPLSDALGENFAELGVWGNVESRFRTQDQQRRPQKRKTRRLTADAVLQNERYRRAFVHAGQVKPRLTIHVATTIICRVLTTNQYHPL